MAGHPIVPKLGRDAAWVYYHLNDFDAPEDSAPSPGAWALLEWARDNRNEFFKTYLPRAADNQSKQQAKKKPAKKPSDDKLVEQLEAMLLEAVKDA